MIPKKRHSLIMVMVGLLIFSYVLVNSQNHFITGMSIKSPIGYKSCFDTDGKNIYSQGNVKYGSKTSYDSCFNGYSESSVGDYVVEQYCQYDEHYKEVKFCSNGCLNGKCR